MYTKGALCKMEGPPGHAVASEGSRTTSMKGFSEYLGRRRREGGLGSGASASTILKEYIILCKGGASTDFSHGIQSKECTASTPGEVTGPADRTTAEVPSDGAGGKANTVDHPGNPVDKLAAFKAKIKQQDEQRDPIRRREQLEDAFKSSQKRRKKENCGNRFEIPMPKFPKKDVVADPELRSAGLAQVLKEKAQDIEKRVVTTSSSNIDLIEATKEVPRMSWDWLPDTWDEDKSMARSTLEIEMPSDQGSSRNLAQKELQRAVTSARAKSLGTMASERVATST